MKVLSALAVKEVVEPAAKALAQETAESFDSFFGPVGALQAKIAAGETADLVFLIPPTLEKLQQEFTLTGRWDLGRVGIGVTVKEGAPYPDFFTGEAFKQMLLNARSIALADPASAARQGFISPAYSSAWVSRSRSSRRCSGRKMASSPRRPWRRAQQNSV